MCVCVRAVLPRDGPGASVPETGTTLHPLCTATAPPPSGYEAGSRGSPRPPGRAFNEIFIRCRATSNAAVTVADLVLDGENVNDLSTASGTGGLDILRISGAQLTDGIALTGTATLSWTGTPPTQSNLAFQIKVGLVEGSTPAERSTWGAVKGLHR